LCPDAASRKPVIAISIGDPYGIGPEVTLRAFERGDLLAQCTPVLYGPAAAITRCHAAFALGVPLRALQADGPDEGVINLVNTGDEFDAMRIGQVSTEGGAASIAAIERATEAVLGGRAAALVTAPISKESITRAGSPHHGHTEMLAELCGRPGEALMILSSNTLRVALVTVHVPISAVAPLVTRGRVLSVIHTAHLSMTRDFGIDEARLAVLALNPHGGDGGVIGHEDGDEVEPAVRAAAAAGVRVDGPFPADGFFSAHNRRPYDLVVAMYHDQGLIPFKAQARGRGVNVTAGLPIVRTSPDHGTAFDIAGRGLASPDSMREAVALAAAIAANRARRAAP
jgi:4-phospho-D-threonate 3-dehydrogenase / 4-phospho-D-erythronate 3-dehydrogenase